MPRGNTQLKIAFSAALCYNMQHYGNTERENMVYLAIAVIGYLIGSVNCAIVLVRQKYHLDVRAAGSGNAGATNTARLFGAEAGLLTLLGDMAKAVVSSLIGLALAGRTGLMAGGLACLAGHCWPVFFRFKGGKGMAVAAGTLLTLDRSILIIVLAFFIVIFLISQRVSLCSVLSALLFPPMYLLTLGQADACFWLGCVMAALIVFQHRQNIVRLLAGTEPMLQLKRRGER